MNNDEIVKKRLRSILAKQTAVSDIQKVDLAQYVQIAQWLVRRYGDMTRLTLPADCRTWLAQEPGLNDEQKTKAIYIASLLLDSEAGRTSEPCPPFQVICSCGRKVSRKSAEHHRYPMYRCSCGKAVGIHKGDGWPLGLLSSREVRSWRGRLHHTYRTLEIMWGMKENEGYPRLAQLLGIPQERCHFALLDSVDRAKEIERVLQDEIARVQRENNAPDLALSMMPMPGAHEVPHAA